MREYWAGLVVGGAAACFIVPPADEAPLEGTSTGRASSSSSSSSSPSPTSSIPTDSADTGTTAESETTDTTEADSTTQSLGDDSDDSDDSGSTTSKPNGVFVDDFERRDSDNLGNGWIERSSGAFALSGGRAVGGTAPAAYRASLFYRPFEEALLDAEISVEFEPDAPYDGGTPQIHGRIQAQGIETPTMLRSYLLYAFAPDTVQLARSNDTGSELLSLGQSAITPPLEPGAVYRLRLRITGVEPVELSALVEIQQQDAEWVAIASIAAEDGTIDSLTEAGSFGASGHDTLSFSYDNLTIEPLP